MRAQTFVATEMLAVTCPALLIYAKGLLRRISSQIDTSLCSFSLSLSLSVWRVMQGESFVISEKVNPALLGGFAVQLGDKYVDLSTLKRIREIERLLQEPVY